MRADTLREKLNDLDIAGERNLFARGFLRLQNADEHCFVPSHFTSDETPLGVFHRDTRLPLAQASYRDSRVVVLGILVDSATADSDPQLVADRLVTRLHRGRDHFLDYVDHLGGRFAIFYRSASDGAVRVMGDATGMRALFQHRELSGIVGSHAALVSVNAAAPHSEVGRTLPRKFGYPGLATPYMDVEFVAPNTEVDLYSGAVHRFYPREPIAPRSTRRATEELVPLMQNLARGYHSRAPVLFSLTAGMDARLALAMQRELLDNATVFTYYRSPEVDTDGADLLVAGDLAEHLNLRWQVLRMRDYSADRRLGEIIQFNAQYAHIPKAAQIYTSLWANEETLHIRSNLSEIGRVFYWRGREQPNSNDPDAWMRPFFRVLSRHQTPSEEALEAAREAFREQFRRTDMAAAVQNIHYLDLMYWEHRMASWHSQVVAESDIAFESVSLYNCRKVLELLLSQPYVDRRNATLYRACIKHVWPELLDWPVNPKQLSPEEVRRAEARIENVE